MQKFRIVIIGDNRNPHEEEVAQALSGHMVKRLSIDEQGTLRYRGMATGLEAHTHDADLTLNFPHHSRHGHFHDYCRDRGQASLSKKSSFHHLFPQSAHLKEIADKHQMILPHSKRIAAEEINEKLLKELFASTIFPVRVVPHGAEISHELLAESFPALEKAIHETALISPYIDIIRQVKGDRFLLFTIPGFRGEDHYVTMPALKTKEGLSQIHHLDRDKKKKLETIARQMSELYPDATAIRTELCVDAKGRTYFHSARPISILTPQPSLKTALSYSGATPKEWYEHAVRREVGK